MNGVNSIQRPGADRSSDPRYSLDALDALDYAQSARRPRLISGLIAYLAILIVGGCSSLGGLGGPVLRVGVAPNYAPVIFEKDGEIVGIEADLAHAAAARLGRRVEFQKYEFADLFGALDRGEIDVIMSGLSVTDERNRRARLTVPYMTVGQLALIRAKDAGRFGRIQGIRRVDARIGYERATTGERFVAQSLTRSIAFGFDTADDGIRSLRAGRIDYFIHDAPTIWHLAGDPSYRDLVGLYRPLTEESLAWAVRRDDEGLFALLNATLKHWQREGRIEPILNRWIPVRIRVP